MCGVCGCSNLNHGAHEEHHHHHEGHLIEIEEKILTQNSALARHNKHRLLHKNILALNLMSSPGSGKTTLLAKTISDLNGQMPCAVIVGDQQTEHDADQIRQSGGHALQINTGKSCHLDAHSVGHALDDLPLMDDSLLFIENIGNLVCPALFDLGEQFKIVILSVTEGENKPLKYPDMFRCADLLLVTKMDLLPHLDFNLDLCLTYARQINPKLEILTLSTRSNEGLTQWYAWLLNKKKGIGCV